MGENVMAIVNTELSAYNDGYPYRESSIRECKALDFLNILENVKAAAANVGLTEQDIKEQIALQFAESRQKNKESRPKKFLPSKMKNERKQFRNTKSSKPESILN